jgi:hypothetical protein
VASIVHPLRPFLSPFWAALSSRKPNEWGMSPTTSHHDRLPTGLIKVQQFAFLNRQGELSAASRTTTYNQTTHLRRRQPVGHRGILYRQDAPLSYFADNVTIHDTARFDATTGDPSFNTLWEGLAINTSWMCGCIRPWNGHLTSVEK